MSKAEKDELDISGGKMLFGRTLQQNVIALLQLAALVRRYDLLSLKRLEGKSTHKNATSLLHGVGVARPAAMDRHLCLLILVGTATAKRPTVNVLSQCVGE